MSKRVVLEFPTEDAAETFCAWFSDGGGESSYLNGQEHMDGPEDQQVIRCDYHRCFPAWGYDPKQHGNDKIIDFLRDEDIK